MNEFELRKYYRQFKVGERQGLSFSAFVARCTNDYSYRRDVEQGILTYRRQHVRERMFQNTIHFA